MNLKIERVQSRIKVSVIKLKILLRKKWNVLLFKIESSNIWIVSFKIKKKELRLKSFSDQVENFITQKVKCFIIQDWKFEHLSCKLQNRKKKELHLNRI